MPKLPPGEHSPDSLHEKMKRQSDHPSPVASAHDTAVQVKRDDYMKLRDIIDAQLRRKLAGEFPYNVLEREVVVSTSTFWQEVLISGLIQFARTQEPAITEQVLQEFLEHVGTHPAAWAQFNDADEVIAALLNFID